MPDDAGLLRRVHDEHAGALRRHVRRLTSDHELAEDVVQEALLRAWDKRRHLDMETDPERLRAWLFTVARNLVVDDARSARRRREVSTSDLPETGCADRVDRVFDSMLVSEALAALSPDHRAVIVRAYYRGHGVEQIAAELQIPPGTVKSRLHYGLRNLRLSLQENGVTR